MARDVLTYALNACGVQRSIQGLMIVRPFRLHKANLDSMVGTMLVNIKGSLIISEAGTPPSKQQRRFSHLDRV